MKRHVEMRYAYREMATPGMFMLTLSLVVVIVGLASLWDLMGMRETMSGMQMAGFISLISGFDFALCYGNGILVLYLVRFRSRFQAIVAYLTAAVILAVPCTVLFYGGYSMLLGQKAPHAVLLVYSVSAACGLWAAALTAYALVLRLERQQSRTLERGVPPELVAAWDERAGPATEPAAADSGAVPAPESSSTAEDGSAESLPPRDSPVSVAESGASLAPAPGVHELGNHELHQEAATVGLAPELPQLGGVEGVFGDGGGDARPHGSQPHGPVQLVHERGGAGPRERGDETETVRMLPARLGQAVVDETGGGGAGPTGVEGAHGQHLDLDASLVHGRGNATESPYLQRRL